MATRRLSKTNYLNGLQCSRYLWTIFHQPKNIPPPDASTQYIFDQGHLVGELAQRVFPNGIIVPTNDFLGNIKETERLLKQRKPLFEAGISVENLYSRVDILNPTGKDEWELISSLKCCSIVFHIVWYSSVARKTTIDRVLCNKVAEKFDDKVNVKIKG